MNEVKPIENVLLVDDEKDICDLLCAMLRKGGTTCRKAYSLKEARAELLTGDFDAIFLDVNLPDGLGYELLPDIRRSRSDTQVFAISAMDQERGNALSAGADTFISKPFDRSTIFNSIRDLGFTI
ncbi:MAG: response regulator [Flavobacteriales bacterium]|nr:response regulator [Flavobacteriales bacterium]